MKEMAAAKSPTDLIQLQSDMFRKSFDSAVAYGSKNTEAMLKIAERSDRADLEPRQPGC